MRLKWNNIQPRSAPVAAEDPGGKLNGGASYGWYSETQAKIAGSSFYVGPGLAETEVTCVTSDYTYPVVVRSCGLWHDLIYVGVLGKFVEKGRAPVVTPMNTPMQTPMNMLSPPIVPPRPR